MTGRPVRPDPATRGIDLTQLIICLLPIVPALWIMWSQLF